jgi:hypothetical protein
MFWLYFFKKIQHQNQHLQLQRWSWRAGDYFEISDFEDRIKLKPVLKDHCGHFIYQTDFSFPSAPGALFLFFFKKNLVSSLYDPTENELQGSGIMILKRIEQGPQSHWFRNNRLPSDFNARVEIWDSYQSHNLKINGGIPDLTLTAIFHHASC